MYRYELNVSNIMNLEIFSSVLSNFISSMLMTVRDDSKFNINEFKIIFDNELGVIDVYSAKDFEELIHRFQLSLVDKIYGEVDDNDDKYFMPMNARYDLHLPNLSCISLISKIIQHFIQSIQLYYSNFLYPIRIVVDLTELVVSVKMYDDFEKVIGYLSHSILPYNYKYSPRGLDGE